MKRLILTTVAAISFATMAGAQTPRIDLYTDANRTACELSDQSPSVHLIYMVLSGNASSTGVRFYAPKPECWLGATWLGDVITQGAQIGDSQSDWSIAFAACKPLPFLFGHEAYFATGSGLSCCQIFAQDPGPLPNPGPAGGFIQRFVWTDCEFASHPLQLDSQKVVINPDNSCRCQNPLAAEPSTWGRVKSLYR